MATEREFLTAYNTLDNELHIALNRPYHHPLIKAFELCIDDPQQAAQLTTIRKYRNNITGAHGVNLKAITVDDFYVTFLNKFTTVVKNNREGVRLKLEKALKKLDEMYGKQDDKPQKPKDKPNPNHQPKPQKPVAQVRDINLTGQDNNLVFEQQKSGSTEFRFYKFRKYKEFGRAILVIDINFGTKVLVWLDGYKLCCKGNATKTLTITVRAVLDKFFSSRDDGVELSDTATLSFYAGKLFDKYDNLHLEIIFKDGKDSHYFDYVI